SSKALFGNFVHISTDFLIVLGKPPYVCAHYLILLTDSSFSVRIILVSPETFCIMGQWFPAIKAGQANLNVFIF
ncbi:hypothetical protein COT96_02855, partial [Candidatus Falkowbacteria bacterium CG10_big_fil_rev_8_21_14_0_10_38_22]